MRAGGGFAEAEAVDLFDAVELDPGLAGVCRVIKPVICGDPEIAFGAGRGVDAVLPAAVVAAIAAVVTKLVDPSAMGKAAGKDQRLDVEDFTAVIADEEFAVEEVHRVETICVHRVGEDARVVGQAGDFRPFRAAIFGEIGGRPLGRPDPSRSIGVDGD